MDPQATLELLLNAIADNDIDAQGEYASNLWKWIRQGGSIPVATVEQVELLRDAGESQIALRLNGHRIEQAITSRRAMR